MEFSPKIVNCLSIQKSRIAFFILLVVVVSMFWPNLSFADSNYRFVKFFGGNGQVEGKFYHPVGITGDAAGNLYVTDWGNKRVQLFRSDGSFIRAFDVKPSLASSKWGPVGIAMDDDGRIIVVDQDHDKIKYYSRLGELLFSFGRNGKWQKRFRQPRGIALDRFDNVYIADSENLRIQKFTLSGDFLSEIRYKDVTSKQLAKPWGIAADLEGNIYVSYPEIQRIVVFDAEGELLRETSSELFLTTDNNRGVVKLVTPRHLCLDNLGQLYVSDYSRSVVYKLTKELEYIETIGASGKSSEKLKFPEGIFTDFSGNLYVADSGNDRIVVFQPSEREKHLNWAAIYQLQNKFGQATIELEEVYRLDSENEVVRATLIDALIRHGRQKMRDGEVESATKAFLRVREIDPLNAYSIRELKRMEKIPEEKQKNKTRQFLVFFLLGFAVVLSIIMSLK